MFRHSQGCYKCGGHPGHKTKDRPVLYQCAQCGFFVCNQHRVGLGGNTCPNCKSTKFKTALTRTGSMGKKTGGMPTSGGMMAGKNRYGGKNKDKPELDDMDTGSGGMGGGSGSPVDKKGSNSQGAISTLENTTKVVVIRNDEVLSNNALLEQIATASHSEDGGNSVVHYVSAEQAGNLPDSVKDRFVVKAPYVKDGGESSGLMTLSELDMASKSDAFSARGIGNMSGSSISGSAPGTHRGGLKSLSELPPLTLSDVDMEAKSQTFAARGLLSDAQQQTGSHVNTSSEHTTSLTGGSEIAGLSRQEPLSLAEMMEQEANAANSTNSTMHTSSISAEQQGEGSPLNDVDMPARDEAEEDLYLSEDEAEMQLLEDHTSSEEAGWQQDDDNGFDDFDDEDVDTTDPYSGVGGMLDMLDEKKSSIAKMILSDVYFRLTLPESIEKYENFMKERAKQSNESDPLQMSVISFDPRRLALYEKIVAILKAWPSVFGAAGYSPQSISGLPPTAMKDLRKLVRGNAKIIAIGDVGLDLHYSPHTKDRQKDVMKAQICLAAELGMPVFLSSKKADAEFAQTLEELKEEGVLFNGIFTSVLESKEILKTIMAHNLFVAVRPEVSYTEHDLYRELLKHIHPSRLLMASGLEHTAPFSRRGWWNEPAFIEETTRYGAKLYNVKPEIMATQTCKNFAKLLFADAPSADDAHPAPTAQKPAD